MKRKLVTVFLTLFIFLQITEIAFAQQKLTLGQILTGLQTQGKTEETSTLAKRNNYIARKIRQNDVTFTIIPEFESELRNAGANDELIQTIHEINSYSFTKIADSFMENKDYDKAIIAYTKAIELNPKRDLVISDRGWAYYLNSDYDLAIADFDQVISMDPEHSNYYNKRAIVYDTKGEKDLAISDYTKAIELNGNSEVIYTNRCSAYEDKEEYDLAMADCRKALEIKPDYERAKSILDRIMKNQ